LTARQHERARLYLGKAAAVVGCVALLIGMEVAFRLGAVGRWDTGAATVIRSPAETMSVASAAGDDVVACDEVEQLPGREPPGCAPTSLDAR
jgi:hypothetical protein